MAKKKVSHHENQQENDHKTQLQQQPPKATAINNEEASSEKLESLKSLNSRLLKDTVDLRKQVDSLMQAKGSLESELTRSNSEKEMFQSELTQLVEDAVRLEVEKNLVFDFVGVQVSQHAEVVEKEMGEFLREKTEIEKKMKRLELDVDRVLSEKRDIEEAKSEKDSEINALNEKLNGFLKEIDNERNVSEKIGRERDELMAKLEVEMEAVKGLQVKLIEAENREKRFEDELEELEAKYKGVLKEKVERERTIESLTSEKETVDRDLMEANNVIEEMKGKIEMISKEKEGIEEERDAEKTKRNELESEVSALNDKVSSLKGEEERLRGNVADLEEKCVESVEKQEELGREIDEMVKEKMEKEKRIEKLVEEKGVVEKDFGETLKQLNEQEMKIEQLVSEKNELAEDKERKDNEILELQKKIEEFKDAFKELDNSCNVHMEKVNNLESEIAQYKDTLKQATVERDEARKGYDEERLNGLALKDKIVEMEKSIDENLKLVEEMKAENANMISEKEDLESQCEMLKKEISSTENTLNEVRKEFNELVIKVESTNADSDRLLSLLRGTAELVCKNDEKDGGDGGEKQMNGGEETDQPYTAQLELIKNAFKNKQTKVEDMARQLEFLQNSVAEAHKKKSFWTLVSSATTLFAAISLAYIARGH